MRQKDSQQTDKDTPEDIEFFTKQIRKRWWRLNNLYWIMDVDGNKVKFQLNWAQRTFYFTMWYLNIILKSRQQGFTTFIQIFMLDACLFNSNIRAGVIAHNKEDAQVFFRDKIKFAYDNLDYRILALKPFKKNDAGELVLMNNSSIRVGTSMRSGTLQYLHVSEFGKICARDPQKAREIVTGSLNTVHEGNFVFIESTAEGSSGRFFDMTQRARDLIASGKKLGKLDYKFHFFSWFQKPINRTDPELVTITKADAKYFKKVEAENGVILDDEQKAWYVKTAEVQGDDMKREHPSTADEAFEQAIEGAYYSKQILFLRENNRICSVPHDPRLEVNGFWDLGRNDSMSIWLHQRAGMANLFIEYIEDSGESIQFYGRKLQDKKEQGWFFGTMYLPHDAEIVDLTRGDNKTRAQVLGDMGFRVEVVPRVPEKGEAHQAVRDALPTCWFDEVNCAEGIKGLTHYQKQWDEKQAVFKDQPLHNWASHPNDAFEQFARGYGAPKTTKKKTKKKNWRTR